jgi:hypothetical protein
LNIKTNQIGQGKRKKGKTNVNPENYPMRNVIFGQKLKHTYLLRKFSGFLGT